MRATFAKMEEAFRAAPLGLATLDLNLRYVYVNEAFATMYRKPVQDFVGHSVAEAVPRWGPQLQSHRGVRDRGRCRRDRVPESFPAHLQTDTRRSRRDYRPGLRTPRHHGAETG